jgi:hypothetical protein
MSCFTSTQYYHRSASRCSCFTFDRAERLKRGAFGGAFWGLTTPELTGLGILHGGKRISTFLNE